MRPNSLLEHAATRMQYEAPAPSVEEEFVAAFLRQVVEDARKMTTGRTSHGHLPEDPELSRAFLRDIERVGFWAELTGADPEVIQAACLREAGMTP